MKPELVPPSELKMDLEKVWKGMCKELLDRNFFNRSHGGKRLYDAGCRGPLCSKDAREVMRNRNGFSSSNYYVYCDAIMAYWLPEAIKRINIAYQEMIDSL